jgi:hypothetical protein
MGRSNISVAEASLQRRAANDDAARRKDKIDGAQDVAVGWVVAEAACDGLQETVAVMPRQQRRGPSNQGHLVVTE